MPRRFRSERLRFFINTSQGKSYTVVFATSLLVLVLVMFAIFPAFSSILTQFTENTERTLAQAAIEDKNATIRQLLASEQQNRAITVALDKSLPRKLNQDLVISDLIALSKSSGAKIQSIRFGSVEEVRKDLIEFPLFGSQLEAKVINIVMEGSRAQLEVYLVQVEQFRRVFNIRNLSITQSVGTNGQVNANSPFLLAIQAEVYSWFTPQ